MSIRVILAALLSAGLAMPANALSCLRPSVQASFTAADESNVVYIMAAGELRLRPGETIPSQSGDPNARKGYSVDMDFTGHLAARGGFDREARFPVTVDVSCAGPWCGGLPQDRVLLFLERTEAGYTLAQGPCPQFALAADPDVLAGALACLRGETCTPPP